MKRFYTFFQASTILSLLVAYAIVLIFFHKDVLPFLADTYLHEYGISYESIEGTLFSGGKIKNLKYNGLHAKEVEIKYNFLKLLRPTPRINSIHAKGVQIDLDSFLSQEVSTTSQAINISKIKIDDSTLVHQKKKYKFNLQASYFTMRETIDIEKFNISLESFYANLKAEGKIARNHLHAKGFTTLSKDIEDEYLDFLSFVPKNIPFLVDIDSKMLSLQISLDTLSLKEREELKLHAIKAELFYNFTDTTFEVLSDYNLEYQEYGIKIVQKSFFDTHGTIWSGLDAVIKNAPFSLPFESFSMDMRKDTNLTNIQFKADGFTIAAESPDLKEFHFDYEMFYAKGKANLTLSEDENYLEAKFILLKTFPFFDTLKLHENKPITVALHQKEDRFTASAFMGEDTITAFYYNQLLHGFINFKAADIWFNSDVETKYLYAHTVIPSLKDTLTKFQQENLDIDAKVEIESVVNFKKSLKIQSTLTLPWFSIDMKKSGFFSGTDAHFDFVYKENELQLKEYQFSVMNHFFYSKKPSKVLLKPNGDIELSEFWIYDSLQAKGYLRTVDGSGYLKLTSDSFTYIRDDANLTLKGTIEAKLDADTKQTITGEIVLTGGEISYQLQKDYAISDEDIVILQDFVFEKDGKEKTNRYVHIEIKSEKDVDYKVEGIELQVAPELFLHQEPFADLQLLGRVIIHRGVVQVGDKEFEFEKSEVYFDGKTPFNPILQLNLHYYTYDYIDIEIYVTNTMSDPVVLFNSTPFMSQEDILSYLLFGGAASSVFDTSSQENQTSLNAILLGAGVKEMINRSTFVKVDTLNILTNQEGTLGYEVGARFNKNIRIVYKNDAISSVVFQYSLNRNLRFDVDVKESGQGVSLIYVKDFSIP